MSIVANIQTQWARGMRQWLRPKGERDRFPRLRSLCRRVVNAYRLCPRVRFLSWCEVRLKTALGIWRPLPLEERVVHRVFHVCLDLSSAGKMVVKVPRGDTQHSCQFIRALRSRGEWARYDALLTRLGQDSWLSNHVVRIVRVRRDGGYWSDYLEGVNLAQLRHDLWAADRLPGRPAVIAAIRTLLDDLRGYAQEHGGLVGDWGLHNLLFVPERGAIVNVDAEGFFMYQDRSLENHLPWIERALGDLAKILELGRKNGEDDKRALDVLRIVREVSRSGESYNGALFLVGYHSLELNGYEFRGQRDCLERLARVPFEFHDKVVVDFGCNTGGMLHALSGRIKFGMGLDSNPWCINAAQAIQRHRGSANLSFYHFDLDGDDFSLIPAFLFGAKVDVCFLLSVCMWLKRWRAVVHEAARLADAVLFESNGTASQQAEQVALLQTYFKQVSLINETSEDDFLKKERSLYFCARRRGDWLGPALRSAAVEISGSLACFFELGTALSCIC